MKLRVPDVTFIAYVLLVAVVQAHYWDIAWRFGGARRAEHWFRELSHAIVGGNVAYDIELFPYVDVFTDVFVVLAFVVVAVQILLRWRIRQPRRAVWTLRAWTVAYLAWLLVLTPKMPANFY